ncbi:MAG TPA: heavy metal translocating P-type ATPase metal-binding domain-containing protein, partial [Polyangiaceae bacterium]
MTASVSSSLFPASGLVVPADIGCAHCRTKLAGKIVVDDAGRSFCCAGCSTVFAAIQGAGLGAFYLARDSGGGAVPARPSGRRFSELDDPELARRFEVHADGSVSTELVLEGVHCASCVWLVENLPRVAPGVGEARLDFGRSVAHVRWDPSTTTLGAVARALDRIGYPPHWAPPGTRASGDRALLVRLG